MKPHKLFKGSFGLLSKIIVPVFISAGLFCFVNLSFAKPLSVNETLLSPIITAGSTTGYISACVGSASTYPNIEQFTVSGSNLTGNITATAPPGGGFQVSLAPGSGYSGSVTINQSGGVVNSTVIYIRSAASASQGSISGNVVLTSTGATAVDVAVKGTVSAYLSVDPVSNQTINAGAATTAINFTGNAYAYTWMNDTPSIGLPASGTGNIPSFQAINNSNSPVTATISVKPTGQSFGYIGNQGSGTISVMNTTTNQIESTITVGGFPYGISVSPDGSLVYIANHQLNNVSVINTSTNAVTATIAVGHRPEPVVFSPDGTKVYVGNVNDQTVSVINTATNTVTATMPGIGTPIGIAISPDGTKLYVVNNSQVLVINTSTNALIGSIGVTNGSIAAAPSPDGTKVYVTSGAQSTLSVADAVTNKVITKITVGSGPSGVCVSPDGSKAFVTNYTSNSVSAVNTVTNTVVATIPVGSGPLGISITGNGEEVYVANTGSNNVSVINTNSNTVVATIPVGSFPTAFGNFITPGSKCITPTTFTITVNPIPPVVSVTGTPSTLTTYTGHASAVTSFNVSGSHIVSGILVTPPTGFEVSASSTSGFGSSVTIGSSGTIPSTPVYLRLAATDASGSYSGNIVCSAGSASVNVPTGADVVNATSNANLTGLKLSGGTLSPAFASGITSYSVSVLNAKTSITVTPTALDPAATIKVNGNTVASGGTSPAIALSVGANTLTVLVTGHDGTMNTYSVTVTRALSANDKLSNLHLSTGTLSPAFAPLTISYTASVSNVTASITETPTLNDPAASIKVNGVTVANGHASGAIALNYGSNVINTVVTAQDGIHTKTYTVTVTRQLSANADLSNLKLSNGTLVPSFSSATTSYSSSVNNAVAQITVTPTTYNANSTVTVNGTTVTSGTASAEIPLSTGPNTITTLVTAQNGTTTKTYTVTVTRAAGGVANPGISLNVQTAQPIDDGIVVHNGLSPNGDGSNDFFRIDGIANYPENKLTIMDRTGSLVYEAKGYDNTSKVFDGHSNKSGRMQLPGTYFYQLTYKIAGIIKRKTGYLVLKY